LSTSSPTDMGTSIRCAIVTSVRSNTMNLPPMASNACAVDSAACAVRDAR
jgi:hypothetical protein